MVVPLSCAGNWAREAWKSAVGVHWRRAWQNEKFVFFHVAYAGGVEVPKQNQPGWG